MPSDENIMKQSCMQFTRSSASFPAYNCNMGYREQLNLLSSHLDGSQIYGENFNVSLDLRLFSGGVCVLLSFVYVMKIHFLIE